MQILHVVDSLESGGLERVVTDLAIEQHRRGHGVVVYSLLETQGLLPELQAAGVEVVVGGKKRMADLPVLRGLRRLVRERAIEVVHAHNFVPNYYVAAALRFMLHPKAPTQVCTCHDMGLRLSNDRLRRLFLWSLRYTRGVAMVGQQVHDRFVNQGWVDPRLAMTVLNGVPLDRFAWSPARHLEARRRLGLRAEDQVVGTVGRLVGLKNQRLLIKVLPALLQRHPALKLVLVGWGELEDTLRAQAHALGVADRVLLTGARTDVADLTPAFDVFALPSQTEGISIALLEACATRLPIVATAVGGNPEIIHDGQTGLLIPSDDALALQTALDTLLSDPAMALRLAQNANAWVQAHASLDSLTATYQQFYLDAMARDR
ncbi:MAG: glycosyltransferase [Leptothrix ochracea]|uniref:glycosyltransferase n=1 Tax=Leptothrix ochracea TaxID=735331 RepID=UPI0034E2E676